MRSTSNTFLPATATAALLAGAAAAQAITPAPAFEACLPCHGPTGAGGEGGGAALTPGLTSDAALGVIASGRNTMPAFRASYSDQELRDLAAYVAERLAPNNG